MESDERLRWIELHVTTSLKPKVDDLKLLFGSEKSRATLLEFLTNEDKKIVYVFYHNGVLNANQDAPLKVDGKFIVFFKIQSAVKITRENINHQLYYMEWSEDFLQHFEDVTRNVFLPILSVEQPGGLSCDRLMDLLHKILSSSTIMSGKLQSMVNLPIPNIEVLSSAGHFHHRQQAVTHILETTLIGWIKQIKNALNDKPNTPMGSKANHFPMPKTEVQFWHKHLSTIQSINEQLCSPQIVSVLTTLEDRNSTYAHSFHNIKRDLAKAEHETMTIVRFLGTLEPYFTLIENGYKLHELIQVFSPMMHTLLLMWTYSKYYHGPDQINRLLQMIANLVVFKAREIVGEAFIDDPESQGFLRQSLKICAAFRGTYLDTKDKADEINTFKVEEQAELNEEQVGVTWHSSVYKNARTQRGAGLFNKTRNEHEYEENFWEDSPWPARNSPVFDVLNKYMERCNDVLELVEVSQQFKKIKFASNLDGAGEPSLNSQIVDIVNDFDDALAQFNCSVKNVLDLDKGLPFESAFFNFHSKVRDLESQFGMLVAGSLKEGWDIKAKLRLLDVFEGITTRDLIQTVLHDILSTFIEHVEKELQSTKQLFDQKMNKKTSHQHLSPVTNQILWLRSLSGRIEELYYKMTKVAPMCFDGERGWRAKDLYKDLCRKIKFTEEQTLAAWLKNFDHEVIENLNQPLLRLDDGLFHVNFDEKLKIVLREIRDMTSHDIPMKLPHDVTQKIENIDILKLQAVNTRLSAATSQFNIMEQNLLDIERNLVNHNIDRARKILTEGVTTYTWNDVHMDDFIQEAIHVVYTDNIKIVDTIKENYERICQIVNSWAESTFQYTMMDESHWPFTFEDYDARQKSIMEDIQRKMKTGCKKIVQHLQAIYEVVKISRTTPQWVAYKEFVNTKVINGLRDSILISLRYIYNSLVAKELQAGSGNTQFLQVDVSLVGSIVYFKPPVDGSLAEVSMIEYFDSWLSAILTRTDSLKELDLVEELKSCIIEDRDIQHLCEQTKAIVADTASECKKLTALFSDYAFLWTQDINTVFKNFLPVTFVSTTSFGCE
uniref:Dynein heavy chain tail domain-containing protein n=1 Tax=Clytia hemisphaerica TaxID=252671 RepID=A0A7M5WU63_9CNID